MKNIKIYYAINGEGRGHAGRSIAIIEKLASLGNDVEIFTSGQGYELLKNKGFKIHEIPKISFVIENNKINFIKTLISLIKFLFFTNFKHIEDYVKLNKPNIIITDFEPLLSKIAYKYNIKLISIHNQHKFFVELPKHFPLKLKWYQFAVRLFIKFFIINPKAKLVTTFHEFPIKDNLIAIGPIIRQELKKAKRTHENFIVVYPQNPTHNFILPVLKNIKSERFVIFCDDKSIKSDNFEYRNIDSKDFADHLLRCKAIICSAGNQTICEASYFNKKCLAVPIPGQSEQEINARYVKEGNLGEFCLAKDFSKEVVINFLNKEYKKEKINSDATETAIKNIYFYSS